MYTIIYFKYTLELFINNLMLQYKIIIIVFTFTHFKTNLQIVLWFSYWPVTRRGLRSSPSPKFKNKHMYKYNK